ncbi:uncharacterized [Tachysurus ichikawai]
MNFPQMNITFLFLFCSECEITNPDFGTLLLILFSCGRKIAQATVSTLTGSSIMRPFLRDEGRRDDRICLDTGSTNQSLNKTTSVARLKKLLVNDYNAVSL